MQNTTRQLMLVTSSMCDSTTLDLPLCEMGSQIDSPHPTRVQSHTRFESTSSTSLKGKWPCLSLMTPSHMPFSFCLWTRIRSPFYEREREREREREQEGGRVGYKEKGDRNKKAELKAEGKKDRTQRLCQESEQHTKITSTNIQLKHP